MPHSTNREMILGIVVGTAGISLLLLWYHKVRKPRTAMALPKFLSLGNSLDLMTLQDEMPSGQGTTAIFQGRQLQILEKLNELLTNMEELKEEIRVLKEAIPKLEEYIQGELGGKVTVHKISPQHRARKRRLATVQSSATSNSSEEAESEGGCCKEEQNCQPKCPADQLPSDLLHRGASSVTQPTKFLDFKAARPSPMLKGSSRKGSKISLPSSNMSFYTTFLERRHSLFPKFQKSSMSFHSVQSRANFDSEEKRSFSGLKSASEHFRFRSRSVFSAPKLSIISCYENASTFDASSSCIFNPKEVESISKNLNITGAEKYIHSYSPEYNTTYFMKSKSKANSSASWDTVATLYQSTATMLTLPSIISYSSEQHGFDSDIQERDQLRSNSVYPTSQSHSRNTSPAMVGQHPSRSVTFPVLHNVEFTSFCKNARGFALPQNEVTSDPFEDGSNAPSFKDEDRSSHMKFLK